MRKAVTILRGRGYELIYVWAPDREFGFVLEFPVQDLKPTGGCRQVRSTDAPVEI
jgi:hypothetical protein